MSKYEDSDSSVDYNALAFEYVTGTLRGSERDEFKRTLEQREDIAQTVSFWEEQLMSHHDVTSEREPRPETWEGIQQVIAPKARDAGSKQGWLQSLGWQSWGFAMATVWALAVTLWLAVGEPESFVPNADYVAVLTDTGDKPLLTALTSAESNMLWLQWEGEVLEQDSSVQLWAKSRRDGQIRPLFVFEGSALGKVALDEATLRLIKDSASLLLTREEEGGSAIDEPSDIVLAKGVCIRLNAGAI